MQGSFICECGREFTKPQSLYAHQGQCKIHLGDRYVKEKHYARCRIGDRSGWAKGLTKETDPRVKACADAIRGRPGTFTGHTHSKETRQMMSIRARYNAKHHLNGWKSGDNRVPNKYEQFTIEFLDSHHISYEREVPVNRSSVDMSQKGYYQLDFIINNTIDLEIDGSSHNVEHDRCRDDVIQQKYVVYRIQHHDSIETLEKKLFEFLEFIQRNCAGSSPVIDIHRDVV